MRIAVAAALLLAGCGRPVPSAPPPPEPDPYPLAPGARWTYRSQIGLKVVREVRSASEGVEMVYHLPFMGEQRLPMRRTPQGVFASRGGVEQLVLRFPLRAGDRWRIDFPDQDLADCLAEGTEEIAVLGQAKACLRVSVKRTTRRAGRESTDTEWYAPGIGLVRMRVTQFGITQTFELESYVPGAP
ncbi:MAG: hypothetical protein HYY17_14550 [Planctomycetes bacterium]|nr:hypothetical protein [Planctomycetota bacterium]